MGGGGMEERRDKGKCSIKIIAMLAIQIETISLVTQIRALTVKSNIS